MDGAAATPYAVDEVCTAHALAVPVPLKATTTFVAVCDTIDAGTPHTATATMSAPLPRSLPEIVSVT
jgi:hypothetical protein